MRLTRSLIPASFMLALALASPAAAQLTVQPGVITVDGRGEAFAAPDTAVINTGVTTQAMTARAALDANTQAMTRLIAALRTAGIESRDIQTTNFSVSPQYVYSDGRDANGYQLPPRIVGYQVVNSVSIKVRKLDTLGAVLDQAVSVGANTIGGISFSVEDTSKLEDEARQLAFADAKAKAELYAELAGAQLGGVQNISEGGGSGPIPVQVAAFARAADASPVPIEGGELSIAVNVSVTWSLRQWQ